MRDPRQWCELLSHRWETTVTLDRVLVDRQDRAVLRCRRGDAGAIVIKSDVDGDRLGREFRAMTAARFAGVAAPAVVAHHLDWNPSVVVMEWVDGEPLNAASPDADWAAVAGQLRHLHDHADPDGLSPLLPDMTTRARKTLESGPLTELLPNTVRERLAQLAAAQPEPKTSRRFLHGDCTPYHWLLRGDETPAVIDFGEAGTGDPAFDLAVLIQWDPGRITAVLDGYGADTGFRDHFHWHFDRYNIIRHVEACDWLVAHGIDPAPTTRELTRIAAAGTAL